MEPGKTYYAYDGQRKTYEAFVCEKEYTPADPEWQMLARTRIVKVPPQSIIVVGGGPTGLMTVIHCTENVLVSGGVMKLYEARDAFSTGGSTFERAQIVRLDARWIAMLRYHLGTGFEDVYIPASGETDAQLGNTL
jgi:threonine dehydrogenase-like Zn-dependent dehydrogenase